MGTPALLGVVETAFCLPGAEMFDTFLDFEEELLFAMIVITYSDGHRIIDVFTFSHDALKASPAVGPL